jgi:hypothetical protein
MAGLDEWRQTGGFFGISTLRKKKSIEKPLGVPGFAGYCIMAG